MKDSQLQKEVLEVSGHYQGAAGAAYFEWQNRDAEITGRIEARKFRAYIRSTDTVLDFGCGGGHVLLNVSCRRRIGIEVNPSARAVASEAGIECYEALSELEDNSIDVAMSNHALEHVISPITALRELAKKLRSSGILVMCVPVDDWRAQRRYDPSDKSHHLHTWTPQLLGNCLHEAGFKPDQLSVLMLTHAWFPGAAAAYEVLPEFLFDALCRGYSVISRRRQLLAVAKKLAVSTCEQDA